DARTQGAPIVVTIGATEDAAARRVIAGQKRTCIAWRGTDYEPSATRAAAASQRLRRSDENGPTASQYRRNPRRAAASGARTRVSVRRIERPDPAGSTESSSAIRTRPGPAASQPDKPPWRLQGVPLAPNTIRDGDRSSSVKPSAVSEPSMPPPGFRPRMRKSAVATRSGANGTPSAAAKAVSDG